MTTLPSLKKNNKTKNIPVILVSATPVLKAHAKEAGADNFNEKPFKQKDLLSLLAKYVQ